MSKTAKQIIGIIVLVLLLWGFNLVGKRISLPPTSEPIKIGVIAPLTGVVADYGEEVRKGAEAGAVGKKVEVVFEDDKCDPKEAVSAFQKLAGFQKVQYVIGPACGSPQEAIVPLINGKEIIAIVPSAASSELFAKSGGNLFNIQYSLEDESKFIAEKMGEMGYKNVALVSYGNAFSQSHANSFRQNFKGKIVVDSQLVDEASDVVPEVTKIAAAKIDAVYSPDISFFFSGGLTKLRQQKVLVPIFSTYVVELPAAREFVSGVTYSYPVDIDSAQAAVYTLSKQATELLAQAAIDCNSVYTCVKDKLNSSGLFNQNGVSNRSLILKQIKDGVPTIINQ
jgi:branched-chain amino acid transport system substrate-binding protein